MSDDTQQPIVVKKIKKGGGGAHGGAWKIAYADFVTAMMAFFLLMWLLGSTAKGDMEGIAEFFKNPLKVSLNGGEGSGDSSSIIKGGGEDLTRSVGQVKRGDVEGHKTINLDAARDPSAVSKGKDAYEFEQRERAQLIDLKGQIEALIEASSTLRALRNQLIMDITPEGLRIQIVDEKNRPMFAQSSDRLQPYTQELLRAIGKALNSVDNRISISGHTDASQYAGGERGFSNWELSSNRANAARRELIAGGLEEGKVIRVVGLADIIPFKPDDPYDPTNRRISIIVMNRKTEQAVLGTNRKVQVGEGRPIDSSRLRTQLEGSQTAGDGAVEQRPPARPETPHAPLKPRITMPSMR
ncbi:flagellar motor protein MotB [Nitrogeniibacter mangrovi]|uniref:Flagellar motor protein MotB n=1 Tax=Nitrogeniibacter mangrovi TaxID=2016596 RepID=A0A6C1B5G7_9RHOO|nr:flagellar motor protein MotB [Nitrogeniibacter mangrovi]QID18279.1 flagellar motor protein MotB [Nitrogeniibacter mangrovi]